MALSSTLLSTSLAAENYPFPQNIDYYGINPTNATQNSQNNAVKSFYDYWKGKYFRTAATGGYYVHGADTDGDGKGTSESHGYGMVITALMAGYDQNAKQEFDGLYQFFDAHRSSINDRLMGWKIDSTESSGGYSSATDGDMDIAYGLLLADKQWGSDGTIDYKGEAIDMITNGLKVSDYHSCSKRLVFGDWASQKNTTRSSDWMPGHLRAYLDATNDQTWSAAISKIYSMIDVLNTKNNNTGLMPDFVTGSSAAPDHNNANGTGESNSGDYFYNAARNPLRIAMDYIHNNNSNAKQASTKVANWAKQQVGSSNNFSNYYSGYTVKGVMLNGANYNSSVFIAPVVVAASVDSNNQAFVNAGWNYIKNAKESYFEDTVNLLSMLAITGNWWAPNQVSGGGGQQNQAPIATGTSATTTKNHAVSVVLSGVDDGSITDYNISQQPSHGSVSLQGNSANYQPNNGYVGDDSFKF